MSFEIFDNLEPPAISRTARVSKYPFANLEIGQAFVVPADELPKNGASSIRAAAHNYTRTIGNGKKFMLRKMEDGGVGVWRTA